MPAISCTLTLAHMRKFRSISPAIVPRNREKRKMYVPMRRAYELEAEESSKTKRLGNPTLSLKIRHSTLQRFRQRPVPLVLVRACLAPRQSSSSPPRSQGRRYLVDDVARLTSGGCLSLSLLIDGEALIFQI